MDWRHDKDKFAIECKREMNRWYDDYTVTTVQVTNEDIDQWHISIMAFHNTTDAWLFELPNITLSKAMLWNTDAMIIWELLHVMIKNAHQHLRHQAVNEAS